MLELLRDNRFQKFFQMQPPAQNQPERVLLISYVIGVVFERLDGNRRERYVDALCWIETVGETLYRRRAWRIYAPRGALAFEFQK